MIKMITYPLNNIDYTAEDAELYFSTRESGIYDGNDFEVTVSGIDNDVTVGIGTAWIHNTKFSGKSTALTEPKTLTLSLPNSVYDRIDAIVIQFDANKNGTDIVLKEGIASSAPIAPTVVRTESLYELHIFHVQRKAGATVIGVDNLVDLRNNSNYCGIMFDPISSIDTTLTKSGYAAESAETGKQIKRATNVRNLLDNSDFRNPVAQAGQNGLHGTRKYVCDRWISWDMDAIFGDGYMNPRSPCDQFIDPALIDVSAIYTAAVGLADGTVIAYSGSFSSGFGFKVSGIYGGITTIDGVTPFVRIASGQNVCWAALYEGKYTAETLPPYVPKGYGAEFLECQRYFQTLPFVYESVALGFDAISGRQFFTPMRIVPTVKIYDSDKTEGYVSVWNNSGITKVQVSNISTYFDNVGYVGLQTVLSTAAVIGYSMQLSADI